MLLQNFLQVHFALRFKHINASFDRWSNHGSENKARNFLERLAELCPFTNTLLRGEKRKKRVHDKVPPPYLCSYSRHSQCGMTVLSFIYYFRAYWNWWGQYTRITDTKKHLGLHAGFFVWTVILYFLKCRKVSFFFKFRQNPYNSNSLSMNTS